MNRNFNFQSAPKSEPIYFESVIAEKNGGGLLKGQPFNVLKSVAVAKEDNGNKFIPIKGYRLVEEVKTSDTTIKIAKDSGVQKGDIIAHDKVGVACTKVDADVSADYDVVTVTLGVAINAGTVLYQAKAASASSAEPIAKPLYILGTNYEANTGDQEVRLINAANLRKETANVAQEIVDLLPLVTLV
nr:MAG TPA: Head fiber protein [Caudoviricetes sp.]